MKPSDNINRRRDLQQIFIVVMATSLVLTVIMLIFTGGQVVSNIFFRDADNIDTGMDFLNSIVYVHTRAPYRDYGTLYPPLANFFFWLLYLCVPEWQRSQWDAMLGSGQTLRASEYDPRIFQPTMVMFIIFCVATALVLYILVQKTLKKADKINLTAFLCIFTYGVIYAFERGNIILFCVAGCLFFVLYRNSENKTLRELALLCLAFSAALKLYPAVFGMLLLYDRNFKGAIKAVIYGILLFVLPVFVFKEGLSGITQFFSVLTSWSIGIGVWIGDLNVGGFAFENILNTVVASVGAITGSEVDTQLWENVGSIMNLVSPVIVLISGFFVKKEWFRALACAMAIMLYQQQGVYIVAFLLIPMLLMIRDERKFNKKTCVPFLALLITQIILPFPGESFVFVIEVFGRMQLCMLSLFYI